MDWKDYLSYTNTDSVTFANYASDSFSTTGSNYTKRTYTGQGGEITVYATLASGGPSTGVTAYISGTTILDGYISQMLQTQYRTYMPSGGTPALLVQVAYRESTWQQFVVRSAYSFTAKYRWPNEVIDQFDVVHAGLMMVSESVQNAWNWITNAQNGATNFSGQLTAARTHANSYSPGPPTPPTGITQGRVTEDNALSIYGGWLSAPPVGCGKPAGYYWQAVCVGGTTSCQANVCYCTGTGASWQWQKQKISVCPGVLNYVDTLRKIAVPSPTC